MTDISAEFVTRMNVTAMRYGHQAADAGKVWEVIAKENNLKGKAEARGFESAIKALPHNPGGSQGATRTPVRHARAGGLTKDA